MRKTDPAGVATDFEDGLNEIESFYLTAESALADKKNKSLLSENSILAVAVLWEGFVHDLIIAYINRDSEKFTAHLQNALHEGLSLKQAQLLSKYATVSLPKHLTKSEIAELIDPHGNNVTFSKCEDMKEGVSRWLVKAHAEKFAKLNSRQHAVINALIGLRNHIAHRSERSHKAMNSALAAGALHPTGLKRGERSVNHVGAYLKAQASAAGQSRLEIYFAELRGIAHALA